MNRKQQLLTVDILQRMAYNPMFVLSNQGRFNLDSEYGNPPESHQGLKIDHWYYDSKGKIELSLSHPKTGWGVDGNELEDVQLLLFPLSSLTKEIQISTYNDGKPFVPIDYFEVTDDSDTCPIEQDYGNIKLINDLKSIAKNNVHFDCQFLPHWVIKLLLSWHFDISGLIAQGLAIDVTTLEHNPYGN